MWVTMRAFHPKGERMNERKYSKEVLKLSVNGTVGRGRTSAYVLGPNQLRFTKRRATNVNQEKEVYSKIYFK